MRSYQIIPYAIMPLIFMIGMNIGNISTFDTDQKTTKYCIDSLQSAVSTLDTCTTKLKEVADLAKEAADTATGEHEKLNQCEAICTNATNMINSLKILIPAETGK